MQNIELVEVREGKAKILIPKAERIYDSPVFYNPIMAFNRDLSVLALRVLKPKTALDSLSATGVRGIRYALESDVDEVWLNDINPLAFELIIKNLELNFGKIKVNEKLAKFENEKTLIATNKDANLLMDEKFRYFEFVDLDPFGSPMPFLDSALRSVKRHGSLGITATDTGPLCGAYPNACIRKYNAYPVRGELCHESGLRILIGAIAKYIAKYDLGFDVLLAYYKDHYFRVFLKVKDGAKKGDETLSNVGYLYFDNKTGKFEVEKSIFPDKRENMKIFGPMWLGPLKAQEFIENLYNKAQKVELAQKRKVLEFLEMIKNELDLPFFYDVHGIARRYRLQVRKLSTIIEILQDKGYKASRTHISPTAIKSDAPFDVFLETLKELQ
jgi:tRNA (guanine26-N2/guanine27-N2)-dimethyltransferase